MMSNQISLEEILKPVEEEWLQVLFTHCSEIFKKAPLPSHDQWHHLRVWHHAIEILTHIHEPSHWLNKDYAQALIIAVFFHDTGLSKTHDVTHGKVSRQLCNDFFEKNQIPKPEKYNLALEAIEKHDDKAYLKEKVDFNIRGSFNALVSVADDLDAFGAMGTFRYLEIYFRRQIADNEVIPAIFQNLNSRFSNFKKIYKRYPRLIRKQNSRYQETKKWLELVEKNNNAFKIIHSFATFEKMPDISKLILKLQAAGGETHQLGIQLYRVHQMTQNSIKNEWKTI